MSWNPAIDPGDEVGSDGSDNAATFGCRRGELNGGPGWCAGVDLVLEPPQRAPL